MRISLAVAARTSIGALLLGLLVTVPTPGALAAHAGALVKLIAHDKFFSPNGDGVSDRFRVGFRLDHRAYVSVLVRARDGDVVKRESLGVLAAGRHMWRWNGRSSAGHLQPDGPYHAVVRARGDGRTGRVGASAKAVSKPDAGRLVLSRPVVYPAATAVVDSLAVAYVREGDSEEERLYGYYYGDRPIRLSTRLRITGPDGERVFDAVHSGYRQRFSWTARDGNDHALPSGDYRLRVKVTDEAGNSRIIRRTVAVSSEQLIEQIWTSTIPAASAESGPGPVYDPACNGCGEVCGPVASQRFPGGLSFLQPCSFGYAAVRHFGAAPPVTPAPVDAFRVTATGGPTTPGDTDIARFDELTVGPGDVSVTTSWEPVDLAHYPYLPDAQKPVTWSVSTSEENDYDIATFTVEYRHYVPAG